MFSFFALDGCRSTPGALYPSENPPATISVPELAHTLEAATEPVAAIPEMTAAPTLTMLLEPTRSPLKAQPRACPQQAQRPYQPLGSSRLLVAASKGAVQGLFELSLIDGTARLVVEEPEWIAKVSVSDDHTGMVYSTLGQPGVTCAPNARPDDPSHWVGGDRSGHIYSRTGRAQTPDADAWRVLGGTREARMG